MIFCVTDHYMGETYKIKADSEKEAYKKIFNYYVERTPEDEIKEFMENDLDFDIINVSNLKEYE